MTIETTNTFPRTTTKTRVQPSQYILAFADIYAGLKQWRLWLFLSWQDIRLHYRRSVLGPFWITLSMAITVYAMGFLYGKLFKIDLQTYYPFIATGMLSWNLIATLVTDGVNMFTESENFIKQMKQPYSIFIFRQITRVFITFFHNIFVLVPIFIIFHVPITKATLFVPIALTIIWLNAFSYCTIFSILSTRFRDLKPIIVSFMQVVFFITPVIWSAKILIAKHEFFVKFNPFAQFLDLLRSPLLGHMPSAYTLNTIGVITVVGLVCSFLIFASYRSRIAYWL